MRKCVAAWLSVEVSAVATPLIMALLVGTGEPETVWSNLSVITGSQAATTLVVAVLFVSRLKSITSSIGIHSTFKIHRLLGSAATFFIILHLIAVVVGHPNFWLTDIFQIPSRALAGISALVILLLMLTFANVGKQQYEAWRWAHRIGGLLSVGLIVWHIVGLNRLINDTHWLLFFLTFFLSIVALLVSRLMRSIKNKEYLVTDIWAESPTVSTISLRPVSKGIRFAAGQFVWIRLSREVWAEDHPFTVASPEHDPNLQLTFRHLGSWTGTLSALRPGRVVWIDGPHGAVNLDRIPTNSGIVMVAVGVGLTPVMSILRTLAHRDEQRQIRVFISPKEVLFLKELADLEERLDNLTVFLTLQQPIVETTFTKYISNPSKWFFLVCGPPAMVADCQEALTNLRVPESRILTEQFKIMKDRKIK